MQSQLIEGGSSVFRRQISIWPCYTTAGVIAVTEAPNLRPAESGSKKRRSLGPAKSQNFAKICIRCDIQIPKLYQQNSDLLTKFELGTVTRIEQDRGWKFHCWLCSTCFIVAWTQNILIHCLVKLRILVRDRNYPCVSTYQMTNLSYFNQTKLLDTYTHLYLFEQNLLWMVQATISEFSKHISDVVDKRTIFVSHSVEEDERNVQ